MQQCVCVLTIKSAKNINNNKHANQNNDIHCTNAIRSFIRLDGLARAPQLTSTVAVNQMKLKWKIKRNANKYTERKWITIHVTRIQWIHMLVTVIPPDKISRTYHKLYYSFSFA